MKFKSWHALAIIFSAVWLVYYPALSASFNRIDDLRMADYLINQDTFGWRDFLIPPSSSYYRPLLWSTFILDRLLWYVEPSFMHFENLFLHWFNATLVYFLARDVSKIQKVDKLLIPCLAGLLFALHPINTEAVIWVAGRADLMATSFILFSMLCALRFYLTLSGAWLLGSVLSFSLGCLCKETTLFVWPGLVLMGWVMERQKRAGFGSTKIQSFMPAALCLPVIGGYFLLRNYMLHGRDFGLRHIGKIFQKGADAIPTASDEIVKAGDVFGALERALTVAGFYAKKLLQPLPLNFGIIDVSEGYFWVGCLLLVCVIIMLMRLSWSSALLLTAVSLASVALFVSFGGISWTPVAERYMYAPAALMSVGFASVKAPRLRQTTALQVTLLSATVTLLFLVAASSTYQRALVWSDNLHLFQDTVNKSPDFGLAKNELAMILLERGEKSQAIEILRNLKITKTQAASLSRVLVHIEDGNLDVARQFLLERLADPVSANYRKDVLNALLNVSNLQLEQCHDLNCKKLYQQEVLALLQKLLGQTGDPFYYYRIGQFLLSVGEREVARENFLAAFEKLPESSLYKEPAGRLANSLGK